MTYYTDKIKLTSTDDDGRETKKRMTYLVEALSCSEAVAVAASDFRSGAWNFELVSVSETKIEKVMFIEDYKRNMEKAPSLADELT